MAGGVEFDYSLAMIARAKKRLSYQRVVVSKLGIHSSPQHADFVRDICAAMQAKLDILELRHADLVRASAPSNPHFASPIPL